MAEETVNDWASTFVRIMAFIDLILAVILIALCITKLADDSTTIVKSPFLASAPIFGIFYLLVAFGGAVYSLMESRTGNVLKCGGIYGGWLAFQILSLILACVYKDTSIAVLYAFTAACWGWKLSNILDI